ncbi:MAG: hypothetical protein H6624_08050 [Bdellovibrionaceae bacterium]|nr:hypothetical protein [Bdellovibrionales bacterium]MCB9084284.1 hypothetical protein [Pseudobdellovibrionaceae bacterium]
MISFGSKLIFWCFFAAILAVLLVFSDSSQVENLRELEPLATFAIGLMAVLVGGIVFRATRPRNPSAYRFNVHFKKKPKEDILLFHIGQVYFSVARNEDDPVIDMPYWLQRLLTPACFLMVGLLAFSHREIGLLEKFPAQMSLGKTPTCEDPNESMQKAEERPECQLVLRAFRLGYATELGDCGNVETGPPKLCFLRQKDEPYLHYASRLLAGAYHTTVSQFDQQNLDATKAKWQQDMDRLESITHSKVAEATGQARSRHFILSNLAPPENPTWMKIKDVFRPSRCIDEFSILPNRIPDPTDQASLSQSFLMASGHLLFDPKYRQTVSACKEYQFLWNVSLGTCTDMIKEPLPHLVRLGILQPIEDLLARHRHKALSDPLARLPKTEQVVSISCLEYGHTTVSALRRTITVNGNKVALKVLRYPSLEFKTGDSVEVLKMVSRLATGKFHYGKLMSRASLSTENPIEVTEDLMADPYFRMTRLAFLEDLDVFLGPSWILDRRDLLEVYPYYMHLNHFVNSFRLNYAQSRGRL